MKLSDLRRKPSINEELDTESSNDEATKNLDIESSNLNKQVKDAEKKYYSISEIEKSYKEFKSHQTEDLKFVDLLLSNEHYNSIYSDRSYRVKAVKTTTDEAIDKIQMDEFSHGYTYEAKRTAHNRSICKVIISIMLRENNQYNYGKPFLLEQIAEEVSFRSKHRPKPRSISRRFTDIRHCDAGFSIVFFKGVIEINGEVIKDNLYILADNSQSNSGLIRKHEMIEYQDDYEWLDWFDDKEEIDKEFNSEEDE